MAVIERRAGRDGSTAFRAKVRLKGAPPQSATFERVTDARRWAQATEAAIREGRYFKAPESRRKTVADLVDRYQLEVLPRKPKSEAQQRRQLNWWKGQLGYLTLADLSPAAIAKSRDALANVPMPKGKRRSGSTVIRYLAVLSHALSVAYKEWCWIDANPMARVSKPKEGRGRARFLSPEERERLFAACRASRSRALYTIVVLAISTGMRRGEVMGLRWGAVDLVRGRATLFETKNGEQRTVPLVGHALECLNEWARVKRIDTDLVFPGTGRGAAAAPLQFEKHWRRAVSNAGLMDFRFHDLRHCTASYLAMRGATLSEIAEVLGHKTLQMVKRYSHLSEAHTRGVVTALDRTLFPGPNGLEESRGLCIHERPAPDGVGLGVSSEKP